MPTLSTEPPQPKKSKKRRLTQSENPPSKKKAKNGTHSKPNGSNGTISNNNLRSAFARIAERRQQEITLLEPALLRGFLMDIRELTGKELPSLMAAKSSNSSSIKASRVAHDVRMLINAEYKKMSDEEKSPDKRRKSWKIVSEIFRLIDSLMGKDDDDNDDDKSEISEQAIQRTPAANGPITTESSKESGAIADTTTQKSNEATGNTQTSGNGKTATSEQANSESSAQQSSTTTTSASKNPTTTDKNATNSVASNGSKTTATSSTSMQKKAPVRTVASLSSASAMTTATALDSNNPSKSAANGNGAVPNKQVIPAGKAPPPYQKHSMVAQQHKNQKLQKQNGGHAPTTTAVTAAATALASQLAAELLPSSSNSNTNGKASTRPDSVGTKPTKPAIPDVTKESEKPMNLKTKFKIKLPADDSSAKPTRYSCFMENRPQVELEFNHHEPTKAMSDTFKRRLEKWDPHWKVEKHFCIGVTAPVTKVIHQKPVPYKPKMAARFISKDLIKKAGPYLRSSYGPQPLNDERRILIRMLPLWISKQKNKGKDRADVHLWPKGTYLQIGLPNGNVTPMPQELQQRKQQSHDVSKWLGICGHLDITALVHKTFSSTRASLHIGSFESKFELGYYEDTPYMFSLAMCRYQSPKTLVQTLLDNDSLLRRVEFDEMHNRVKKIMESNEVILDGDSDEDDNPSNKAKEQKSIRFSIRDPIQRVVLQNPVRGRRCLHISVSTKQ